MISQKTDEIKEAEITEEEYALFRDLIHREFGIAMQGDKRLTLQAKLSHRLAILGLTSYRQYYDFIIADASKEELYAFLSHITNNETYFQREVARIQTFAGILNDIKRYRQQRNDHKITLLSAGCSSGEEVYTLNITLMESGLFAWGWEVSLIGVDANVNALKKAQYAIYTKNSFRALNGDEGFIRKYFERKEDQYILRRPYRTNVCFRHGNILTPKAFEGIRDVDAIFCRNVLIYMSDEAIRRVIENFYAILADEGYLFIGASESLLNKTDLFVPEYKDGIVIYRKNHHRTPED